MFDQSLFIGKKIGNIKPKREKSGNVYLLIKLKHQKLYRSTGLIDSPENRRIAEQVLKKLHEDYMNGLNKPKTNDDEKVSNFLLQRLFNEFLEYKIGRGISKGQVDCYIQANKSVFREKNYDVRIKHDVGRKSFYALESEIKMFVESGKGLSGKKLKPITINNHIRAVQTFLNFLFEENVITEKIYLKKYLQKIAEKTPDPYSEEEMQMILDYAKNNLKNYEIYLWLKFLSLTGSRGAESLTLTWNNVDYKNDKISFVNKINKQEIELFHISKSLYQLLEEIKNFQSSNGYTGDKIFRYRPASVKFLYRKLIFIQEQLKIRHKGRGVHGIRRYFLSKVFKTDIPLTVMSALCRHKDLNLTKKLYNKFNNSTFEAAYDKIGL